MKNPVLSSKRSERRRRNTERVKRAIRLLTSSGWPPDQARKNADHMKACACWMCNHYRSMNGITQQEKRSLLALNDEY